MSDMDSVALHKENTDLKLTHRLLLAKIRTLSIHNNERILQSKGTNSLGQRIQELPPELRDMIYTEVFRGPPEGYDSDRRHYQVLEQLFQHPGRWVIMHLPHEQRIQYLPYFLQANTFRLEDLSYHFRRFARGHELDNDWRSHVRSIRAHLHVCYEYIRVGTSNGLGLSLRRPCDLKDIASFKNLRSLSLALEFGGSWGQGEEVDDLLNVVDTLVEMRKLSQLQISCSVRSGGQSPFVGRDRWPAGIGREVDNFKSHLEQGFKAKDRLVDIKFT